MSILEKIRKAREDLKTVETTVTMEDGRVAKEKRSSKGEFVYVDEEDEDATSNGDETKEMQENLGYVLDLKPDLQMANVAKGIYLDLPWTNLEQHFDKCHEFMEEAVQSGGNVLVHCNAGVSRSATIVLSYIMRYNKMTLREALEHVNAIRKGVKSYLLDYEKYFQALGANTERKRLEDFEFDYILAV
ncbi:hypothetical protein DINM_000740 [Dirofilaria immitis]|nr:hypothetical protein [Dirofilaria immitis]